jgi:hypothetical protein
MNVQPQFPQATNQGVPPGYFPPVQQQQQTFVQQQHSGTYPQQSQPNTGSTPPNLYSSAPIPAQNQNQYSPPGGPGNVGSYEYNPYQQAVNAHSDPRFVNNPSPPLYNQPADRKVDGSPQPQLPQPQSPPAAYNQQQQQQFQPQYQQERGFNPQSQPQPYPVMQTSQPVAVPGMDVRNVKNLPRNANGEREWSNGLCDCCGDCGTCACSFPFIFFLSRLCPPLFFSALSPNTTLLTLILSLALSRLPLLVLPMHRLLAGQVPPRPPPAQRLSAPKRRRLHRLGLLHPRHALVLWLRMGIAGAF